ncbi:MAG: hypothetical protein HC906_03940 [Bacteroidales bacterium]|nr:hypothetical protein [Bacteroidales bacterium]
MYHSLRGHVVWVMLDSLPIALLVIIMSAYYLHKVYHKWFLTAGIVTLPFILISAGYYLFKLDVADKPNLGYFAMGIPIIFSLILYLYSTHWKNWRYNAGAICFILAAILFRIIDNKFDVSFLFMGTHWLWHIFSTFSAHLLLIFIYLDDKRLAIRNKYTESMQIGDSFSRSRTA